MNTNRVIIGLSGGIDSAMAAYLLQKEGFEVYAVYLRFFPVNSSSISHVQQIAHQLNIQCTIIDASTAFQNIIVDGFISELMAGRTPSPCIDCNPNLKWKLLSEEADKQDAHWIATGHYMNITSGTPHCHIRKAADPTKDQSYFLWTLPDEILRRIISPLGIYTKAEVRQMAIRNGFNHLAQQKESTGLCFANGRSIEDILVSQRPDIYENPGSGMVVDRNLNPIGKHMGYPFYTIGQKKGLDLDVAEKLCVVKIDAQQNILVADTWQSLYTKSITATNYRVFDHVALQCSNDLEVKIRGFGLNPSKGAKVWIEGTLMHIELHDSAWAPAPGQPMVIYKDDWVVAGGIIC